MNLLKLHLRLLHREIVVRMGRKRGLLFAVLALVLQACGSDEAEITGIDSDSMKVLQSIGAEKCKLKYLPNEFEIELSEGKAITVAEEEINALMPNPADYAIKIPSDHNAVINGDYIIVDYALTSDNNTFTFSDIVVHVGAGKYADWFEEGIVGAEVNKEHKFFPRDIRITSPDDKVISLMGPVETVALVKEIYSLDIPKLDDRFAYDYLGFDSLDAYKQHLYEELYEGKVLFEKQREYDSIISQIRDKAGFKMDEESVVRYGAQIYKQYEQMAYTLGLSMKEYAKRYLECNEEDIYNKAYDESVKFITECLIVGGLSKKYNLNQVNDEPNEAELLNRYSKLKEICCKYVVDNW